MAVGFEGWSWKEWLKANKSNIRLIISGTTGIAVAAISGLSTSWAVALGGIVAAGSKLLLDSLDYYLSE